MPDDLIAVNAAGRERVAEPASWSPHPTVRASHEADPGRVAALFEAGMAGDVHAWDDGLSLWYGTRLDNDERARFLAVGGPPPLALERALARLRTHVRPPGHLERFRSLVDRYRLAMDGDEGSVRWIEVALGLPVRLADLGNGLEPGRLDDGWLTDTSGVDLSQVCRVPAEPEPVWVQLHVTMGRSTRG